MANELSRQQSKAVFTKGTNQDKAQTSRQNNDDEITMLERIQKIKSPSIQVVAYELLTDLH